MTHQGAQLRERQLGHEIEHGAAAVLGPAPGAKLAVAVIEADGDAAGMTTHHTRYQVGLLDSRAADHDARQTCREQIVDIGFGPHASARLHRDLDSRGYGLDHRPVHGFTGASRVEVDHVDPRCTGRGKGAGLGDGVVAVDGLGVEVALDKANAAAVAHVDRG